MPKKPKAEFEITALDRASRTLNKVQGSVNGLGNAARATGVIVGAAFGGAATANALNLSDEYTRLANRVQFLTRETGNFDQVYQGLLQTVFQTGNELSTSLDIFQSLDRVRDELNLTDQQILQLNSNLLKLGVIGNTSTEAQSNGLRQLNQAFAGGVVRAEEFNSLLENTPEIAAAIAKGFGVTQGQLRLMVNEGRVFSGDVARVLLDQSADINDRFNEIPNNLDRAFSTLEATIGTAFSKLDQSTGVTSSLASVIDNLARSIRLATGSATELDQVQRQIIETQSDLEVATKGLEESLRIGADDGISGWIAGLFDAESATETYENRIKELQQTLEDLNQRQRELSEGLPTDTSEIPSGSNNEEQIFRERLARLQGFNSVVEQEQANRLQRELQAELAGQRRRLEEVEAQELGYASVRERKLAELEQSFQDNKLDREKRQREEAFALELAQLAGFADLKEQEEAIREADRLDAILARKDAEFEQLLVKELGFVDRKAFLIAERERQYREDTHQELLAQREEEFEEELAQALGFASRRDQELQEQERRHQLQLQIARANGNKLAEQAARRLYEVEILWAKNRVLGALSYAEALTEGFAGQSETAFNILKGVRLAEAIINTATGVTSALSQQNYAAAALIAAQGAAQIQTIRSQSFNGGGGTSSFSGGGYGSGGSTAIDNPIREIPVVEAEERNNISLELILTGGDEVSEAVASNLAIRTREGDEVTITRGSRQEIELAGGI